MATVTHQIGNTTIILHSKSDVILMSAEEQRAWFCEGLKAGNPVLTGIAEVTSRVYLQMLERQQQEVGA